MHADAKFNKRTATHVEVSPHVDAGPHLDLGIRIRLFSGSAGLGQLAIHMTPEEALSLAVSLIECAGARYEGGYA